MREGNPIPVDNGEGLASDRNATLTRHAGGSTAAVEPVAAEPVVASNAGASMVNDTICQPKAKSSVAETTVEVSREVRIAAGMLYLALAAVTEASVRKEIPGACSRWREAWCSKGARDWSD